MKKISWFFTIALVLITLGASSCFDIVEEYHFNEDGSGTATYTIDMSSMIEMMSSFAESMDSLDESMKGLDEIFTDESKVQQLNKIPGIRNVKSLNDKEKGIAGYSYEFANLDALNNAIEATQGGESLTASMGLGGESSDDGGANRFDRKGKKLTRTLDLGKMGGDDEEKSEEDKQSEELAKMMFNDHFYTLKYSFDRTVKKVKKNDLARISSDKKAVEVKVPLSDLMDGKAELGCQIKLK